MRLINGLFPKGLKYKAPRFFLSRIWQKNGFLKRIAILFLLMLFFLIMMFPIFPHLVVLDGETNKMLYHIPVRIEEQFIIHYIHSIHLTPVDEIYHVNANMQIVVDEVHFDTYSVGMPSELNAGETIELKDGKIMIKNMNRSLPYIDLRIGQVIANHQLIIKNQTIQMSDIAPPGSWIRLKMVKLNIFKLMGEVFTSGK